ncbi:MAG TPA: endonuclease/exonuclease/phosphatase family protein [Opitutus sp.]|nr:endonuclease/exonuclease/phosphatase family protein [Opitutus sp.]
MLARLESMVHAFRRRLSRNEWAVRHLGLTPSEGTSEQPGLLLIQIDGLARRQLEAAMAAGRMPFLARLVRRDGYELRTFYPGLPATTPAVQAELYYGVRSAVPAFSFFDRARNKIGRMWDPDWAKAREAVCREAGAGLLTGGSSWSNIYTGGAKQEESHFCAASIGLGDIWRSGKLRNAFLFAVLQAPALARILWLTAIEFGVALGDAGRAIARGRRPKAELTLVLSRAMVGVGLRELLTVGGQIDVTRGLPVVHLNFVGYDEQAHARGPGSKFAHFGLRGIDGAIRRIVRAAKHSRRRDYAVWIFSDHGQEQTRPYDDAFPEGIEAQVRWCLEIAQGRDPAWRARSQRRPVTASTWLSRSRRHRGRLERWRSDDTLTTEEGKTVAVAAMGPVGHVYFAEPKTDGQRLAVARRLVERGGVPGVLVPLADGRIRWLHKRGETSVPDEVAPLLPQPAPLRAEIARDLARFCRIPDAGDLILLGWSPWDGAWSFAPERGGHGGCGPDETQGFLLVPARTRLPAGTEDFVRPAALRAAAWHYLGRASLPATAPGGPAGGDLRLMTYNVHGCSGMDGRISPRRVARVVASAAPDLVALQEIDLGRRRSRAEDQAALIARDLGMHVVFCPTVTRGQEHYGHALLSRWPVEVVKRAMLPHDPSGWWQEPRAAMWVRVLLEGAAINVITTHLGLGRRERLLQMQALLGGEWLGRIPEAERVVFCGDLNLGPGSTPYGLVAARLHDVQAARQGHRPLRTFSSLRPFARIDHIFISKAFNVRRVLVPRNDLTRLASDHLPLVADLGFAPAAAETTTTSPR